MSSKKVTIKGRGSEMFGRGIDLLFGEADEDPAQRTEQSGDSEPAAADDTAEWPANTVTTPTVADPAREASYLDSASPSQPASTTTEEYLRQAAEAFSTMQPTPLLTDAADHHAAAPNQSPAHDPAASPAEAGLAHNDSESDAMPTPQPNSPVKIADVQQPAAASEGEQRRRVGVPSGNGASADDSTLSADIARESGTPLTRQEGKEIASKLRRSDLNALDREVDALYDKVGMLLSGQRQEATVAFDILRQVRTILLKEPERFADAEYLLNQVRARTNQIERSIEGGRLYVRRIFAYQTVWLAILGFIALTTTVNGTTFRAWTAFLLGLTPDSEQLGWAVLFLSTLAWGGIGGVTCALWSLYHHISVMRDYDPVENLWYYSQPMLGMVLGGIVFLIMGAGFLAVQVDLSAQPSAALGARLLPAAIAVIAGFRQTMVLDLIERIIALIVPGQAGAQSQALTAYQPANQQPPEEPMI